jgi:hypothetical protein
LILASTNKGAAVPFERRISPRQHGLGLHSPAADEDVVGGYGFFAYGGDGQATAANSLASTSRRIGLAGVR